MPCTRCSNARECEDKCRLFGIEQPRKTRDVAAILRWLTPQQMAEEIVRLDAVIAGGAPDITMARLPNGVQGTSNDQQEPRNG